MWGILIGVLLAGGLLGGVIGYFVIGPWVYPDEPDDCWYEGTCGAVYDADHEY